MNYQKLSQKKIKSKPEMKNLILTALLSLTLWGCITEKKQRFNAEQFYRQHPEELALNCSEKFPVKTEYLKGEEVTTVDTVFMQNIVMDCPTVYDTVTHTSYTPKVICPEQKVITIEKKTVNTLVKENTAKVEAYRLSAETLKQNLAISESKGLFLQKKMKERFWFIIALCILLLISVTINIKSFFVVKRA